MGDSLGRSHARMMLDKRPYGCRIPIDRSRACQMCPFRNLCGGV